MPRKKNMDLYEKKQIKVEEGINKTVRSQLRASQKYDKQNVDSIRLRVPKGWNDVLKEYVRTNDKYSSVNSFLNELIKKELQENGIDLPDKD